MAAVFKAKVEITVFMIADSEADAREQFQGLTLAEIAEEAENGAWIAAHGVTSIERVPAREVEGELLAIGNDGHFFDDDE